MFDPKSDKSASCLLESAGAGWPGLSVLTVLISRSFAQKAVCSQRNVRLGEFSRKFSKNKSQVSRLGLSLVSVYGAE